jgi:branched-chain amino acid transport system substrate-binding protein
MQWKVSSFPAQTSPPSAPATLTNSFPAYEAKFGSAPLSIFHAHAYDAMNMVLACIENPSVTFKSEDGTLHIGRQALRDCMYATQNFAGLTGTLSCSQYGDCGAPVIAAYEYHAGEYPPEKVWP